MKIIKVRVGKQEIVLGKDFYKDSGKDFKFDKYPNVRLVPETMGMEYLLQVIKSSKDGRYCYALGNTVLMMHANGSIYQPEEQIPAWVLTRCALIRASGLRGVPDANEPLGSIWPTDGRICMWVSEQELFSLGVTEVQHDSRSESKSEGKTSP